MAERILMQVLLQLLKREQTRSVVRSSLAVALLSAVILMLLPVMLIAIPLVFLGSYISTETETSVAVGQHSREQIALVERYCTVVAGYELDIWVEGEIANLVNQGIPEELIYVSLPPQESRRILVYEIIILWSVEHGERPIDISVKKIVELFVEKGSGEISYYTSNGELLRRGEIHARMRSFEEALDLREELSEEQRSVALLMLDVSRGSNQLQRGIFLGSDQLYTDGDFTFHDGQIPVNYYHQCDSRWANVSYAGESIGIAGCGPAAVAMVVSSLTMYTVTPREVASWAELNGYAAYNNGSHHSLIPKAAEHYGLTISSGNDPEILRQSLQEAKLAIAIMGPGSFTPTGHFIVLRGITADGRIIVADPVSLVRSNRVWDVMTIYSELRLGAGGGGPVWVVSRP
ncbi:MAG: C39 family peptidase [Symbiobacteriaceae bacterium]|nr:C39 family peptidase [Symbiobacteriaceae bacterium]